MSKRVLMVDRSVDFTNSISFYAKRASPDVDIEYISDGEELVRRARNGGYSMITTVNWLNEQGDGLEAIRRIRVFDREVPIYMVTGSDVRDQALEAGATDFIAKEDLAREPEVYVEKLEQIFKQHLSE